MAGADPILRRVAGNCDLLGAYEARRGVASLFLSALRAKLLDQLRVVNARAKVVLDRIRVGVESVRGQLEAAGRRRAQLLHEVVRVPSVAPAQVPSQDELGMALKADEAIGVAGFRVGDPSPGLLAFLAMHVAPYLVGLYVADGHALDGFGEQAFAAGADLGKELEDRNLVGARRPADAADSGALAEEGQDQLGLLRRDAHVAGQRAGAALRERLAAGAAAEALAAVTGAAKLLGVLGLAKVAGHGGFPRRSPAVP